MVQVNDHPAITDEAEAVTHFRLHLDSVIVHLLSRLNDSYYASFPFLTGYQPVLEAQQYDRRIADCELTQAHLPLRALRQSLSDDAVWVLVAAGLIEEDFRFGAVFASLQEPLLSRRPCIGLLNWLLPDVDVWAACRDMIDASLLVVDNMQEARAEWVVRVPSAVWDAARGHPVSQPAAGLSWQRAETFPDLDSLVLPANLRQQVLHLPDLIEMGQVQTLVLRGMTGSGRRTIAGAVAKAMRRDVLVCELDDLPDESRRLIGPLATLIGAMPVLRCNPAPGDALAMPTLAGYSGPVAIAPGRVGGLRGSRMTHALTLTLPPPDRAARQQFWQQTEAAIDSAEINQISQRFLLTGGLIHRAAQLGQSYAALDNRDALSVHDVQMALRAINRQSLETLATPLEGAGGWADLVVSAIIRQELRVLEARCLQRESLREQAGRAFTSNLNRGVRALFSGPSGTGKTLAARVLASELQMDLYRVDLASVVNKYIGETERNLNEVFSRAEELDVVLLLDEGDSLMSQRTDVRSSNDRYANLETNYLLQRLENYEGIVIITTNAAQRIDQAFMRRLDVVIDFSLPETAERGLLWALHLPGDHAISTAFMDDVVNRCNLSGGQIRNAALYATLLALDGGQRVTDDHLKLALQREYRKAGAAYPYHDARQSQSQLHRLRNVGGEPDGRTPHG